MGLLDDIIDEQGMPRTGPTCRVAVVLDGLDADDRAGLETALADPAINHTVIGAVLRARDIPIGNHSVSRHRRGHCVCAR